MKKIFIFLFTYIACFTLVKGQNNTPNASVIKPVPTEPIFTFPTPSGSLKMNISTETVFKVPVKSESQISAAASNLTQSIQKTTFEDGFGRVQQSQIRRANSQGKDMVQAYYYGKDDNTEISPLPLPISLDAQGFYRDVNNGLRNAYNNLGYADENYLYEKVVNEKSPLNRPIQTLATGNSWVGSNKSVTVNSEYIENANIPKFSIGNSINSLPINVGFYTKLLQVTNTDEDFASGKSPMKKSFYDAQGQLICEKMESSGESTLTCFVYDDYGQLRYTITPKAMEAMVQNNNALSPNILNNLCFRNEYDDLGRLIFSKKPEIGAVNFVYDKFDRPILTQDAIQKQTNKWVFIKYDEMGRVIQSGIFDGVFTSPPGGTSVLNDDGTSSFYPSGSSVPYSRANLQVIVNSVNISNLFLNYLVHIKVVEYAQYLNFPDAEVMQVNIYDQYDQIPFMGFSSNLTTRTNGYLNEKSNKIKGLLTGTISKTSNNANLPVRTAYFYNNRQELILKATRGNNNSLRFLASGFDFSGRLIKTISRHSKIEISKKFSYDIYDRLTMIEHRVNSFNNYRPIARYFYDDLGRMRIRKLGGMGYNVNYHYNIRNWIVGINRNFALTRNNNDYFGMEVSYDNSFTETYLNGRVAGVKWRNKGTINEQRSYGYLYDGLGRLQLGDYHQITEGVSTTWSKSVKDFTTSNLSYDKNGNILTMKNMGVNGAKQIIVLDDLQYHYAPNSNRLLGVSESSNSQSSDPNLHNGLPDFRNVGATGATDYNYDANGNKSSDLNKGISNIDNKWFGLNKPIIIEFANNDKIEYVYDAMGSLIGKKITQVLNNKVTTYDYVDEVIYKNGHLDGFSHEEGRIRVNSADDTYTYDYYIKDYLQNIRSVISESQVNSWGGDTHIDDIAWSPNPEQAEPDNPDGGLISEPTNAPDGISNSPVLYLATSEIQNDTLEELFFDNLDETRGDRVFSNDTGNLKSANLNPSECVILGPGIMLKVMAGDQIQLGMEALYFNNTQPGAPVPLANIVSGLLGVLRGQGGLIDGIGAGSLAGNLNADGLTMVVSQMHNQTQDSTKPKAFLNYLMFDESMQIVLEQSGALQVEQANAWSNLTQPIFQINQNGYIYVYSCNTSAMTVRTDNLFIAHYQGSLLEEFHYYPFGMCFDVSKSPTLGKSAAIKYNSQLHEHDEFEDANGNVYGLEDYNFAFRNYDAQIGRWLQPDPLMQHPSPYLAMSNNPVSFTDPLGLWDGNPILDRNGYPISGLFSTDGAYYQVDWSLTVSNGHNVGSTAFYVSEMDEYNYKIKSLNKYFSPLYDKYYHTMYANGNLRRNGEAYGEVAARYFDNQLAWGMSLKEGGGQNKGGGSNVGNWLSGFDIAAGLYSEYGHNHTTYTTTKGIEKNIYKANGQIRSARAAGFARTSNLVRGLGLAGSAISTAYTGIEINNALNAGQVVSGWKYADFGIGFAGTTSGAILMTGLVTNPIGLGVLGVVGSGALMYGGLRLGYQLINEP